MPTSDPQRFKTGLIFQEIKGSFTVLADFMGLLYQVGMMGNPLKQTAINRYETILRAGVGVPAFTRGSAAFIFMLLTFNTHVEHGQRTPIMTKDCARFPIGICRQ